MQRFLFLFFLFVSATSVLAQDKWTLTECIDYAVENNLDVKSTEILNKMNKESHSQAVRNLLPSLSVSNGSSLNFGKSIDPTTNDYVNKQFFSNSYSLGANITLFEGFSAQNRIAMARLNYLAGLEKSKYSKNEVALGTLDAFFNVLFYQGLLEISIQQKDQSLLALKQSQVMVETGLQAKTDLLEMESRLATEELAVVQSRNLLESALLDLKQQMNYSGTMEIDQAGLLIENPEEKDARADSVYSQALRSNPLIKANEMMVAAAQKNVSVARGNFYPSVGLYGNYSTDYSSVKGEENAAANSQFKNNASQAVGVSVQIPVFNKGYYRSEVKIAKLGLDDARNNYGLIKQQLQKEIEKNSQEMDALYNEFLQTSKQMEAATLAFEAAEKKRAQGLIDIVSYYDSKNLLAQAKSNVLRTKLQYGLKKRTVDFIIGLPIYSVNK